MKLPPIEYVIVLMLENRSFDHMLGFLKAPDYPIEGLNGDESNIDDDERMVAVSDAAQPAGDFDPDPGHDFDEVTIQLFGTLHPEPGAFGDMSGFVKSYSRRCNGNVNSSHRIMKCFSPAKLPVLTTLAKQYAVCDHWFSSVPGPTLPNRLFAHAGTSGGRLDMSPNDFAGFRTIHELLDRADVSSTIYADGWSGVATIPYLLRFQSQFFAGMDDFEQGCRRGKLSSYSFIEPRYGTAVDAAGVMRPQNDQHPDSDVQQGENLIFRVYETIRRNIKVWNKCALVITYDEHGGLYDHVPPPPSINPDGEVSVNPAFDFRRLGVRVPAVIVSPFVRAGTILKKQLDHTSLLASAVALLRPDQPLGPDELGARAAAADNTFLACFDESLFGAPRRDQPAFGPPAVSAPQQPTKMNDLMADYVKQAVFLEQQLLPSARTGIDASMLVTDRQAQEYLDRVFAAVKSVPISELRVGEGAV